MAFTNHAVQVVTANGRQALWARNKQQFPPEIHVSADIAALFRRSCPDRVSEETLPVSCAHTFALPAYARTCRWCHLSGATGEPAERRTGFSAQASLRSARRLGIAGRGSPRFPQGVDTLLTPDLYEELRRAQEEADDHGCRIVQAEKDMARQTGVEHVEFEVESEEWGDNVESEEIAQAAAVDGRLEDNTTAKTAFAGEQKDDVSLESAWEQARADSHGMVIEDGLLFHAEVINGRPCKQLVLPESRSREVLVLAHDRPCGGHFSQKKTNQCIRSAFFWPNLASDVKKYCQSCHSCQAFANKRVTDRVPIIPLTRPQETFEVVYLDCIGPIEPASACGHRYALCLIDLCTRWPEVIPLSSLTAQATCQALLEVFARFGTPQLICCDQGTNFTAALTKEPAEWLGF